MKYSYITHLEEMSSEKTSERKIDYFKYNFGEIVRKLKSRRKIFVLEIGPGKGEFIEYLRRLGIRNIDIIDNDTDILKSIREKFNISNAYHSSNVLSLRNKLKQYDLIVMVQVLEHLSPSLYPSLIRTLFSKLRRWGYILIVVPNAGNPLGLVERYGDLQHQAAFTEQSLKDLLIASGIKNYDFEIKGYSIPPYNPLNLLRILLQKVLHTVLLAIMVVNGGSYFKTMTPNITLIIKKKSAS